jgi:uncharacterized protein YraI
MKYLKALCLSLAALGAMPASSSAHENAYVSADVHLRAGPAREYPTVALLRPGVTISVVGCLSDYAWCDVVIGPDRGWVYGGYIVYPYQGTYVPVISYGPMIGISVVTFSLGMYWDEYYRARPWYPQRERWIARPYPAPAPYGYRIPPPRPGVRADRSPRPQQRPYAVEGERPPHVQPQGNGKYPPPGRAQVKPQEHRGEGHQNR